MKFSHQFPGARRGAVLIGWVLRIVVGISGAWTTAYAQEVVRTVAGRALDPGHVDGPVGRSRFHDPAGLAVDATGNLLVADSANHCIRRISLDGAVVTVLGKPGEPGVADGSVGVARLDTPSAVALGPDGGLYIADTGNHTLRRWLDGRLITVAGRAGEAGPTNGPVANARFNSPLGIVVTPALRILVADSGNHAIRSILPNGLVETLAGSAQDWGAVDGPAATARFNGPVGLALAPDGVLVVSDTLNHALRRVTPDGQVTTLAGRLGEDGCVDGSADVARFCQPAGLYYHPHGDLYVVDAFNHLVRKVDAAGVVTTVAGRPAQSGEADGANGAGRFFNPYGLVVHPDGSIVVSDTYNATLRQVLPPFRQRLVRQGREAVLQWESVIGLNYQPWIRSSLDPAWRPLAPSSTANDLVSTVPVVELGRGEASTFFQVRRAD